jgi:hypothetical protein
MSRRREALPGWAFWRRWVVAVTAGEIVGFAAPSVAGAVAFLLDLPDAAMIAFVVPAGGVEGAVLGFAQWLVLRGELPALSRADWVRATAAAAMVAWAIGASLGAYGGSSDPNVVLLVVLGVPLAIVLLCSLGFAQWLVLRRHIDRAGWWVPANVVAWGVGVTVAIAAMSPMEEGDPAALLVALGVVAGALMGLVVSALTGGAMVWLLRRSHERARSSASIGQPAAIAPR